jgi:hypothetical protein
MKFVSEPNTATKIRKMKERVRWEHPAIVQPEIDQTRFVLEDGQNNDSEFSFLVIGDSGTGRHRGDNPQRRIAETLLAHSQDCRFILHTGDVVYLVGSKEQYPQNFIKPYREFIVGGEEPERIHYDRMVFKMPILPVLGNHDYYDLPWMYGLLAQASWPLRYLLQSRIDIDVGWHGSFQGDAYARAFLDYLQGMNETQLARHLDRHYTAIADNRRCLTYQPSHFTRLPNRYYTFRYGAIDFFALDSNTFNVPLPLPDTLEGRQLRQQLEAHRQELEEERMSLLKDVTALNSSNPEDAEKIEEIYGELEQLGEQIFDVDKQLSTSKEAIVDFEQLQWLQQRLIDSWQNPEVRGRVIYFHHPPYVTEATKWSQGQTLAVRSQLRQVLNAVRERINSIADGRPLVDLIITGHAHCLEHLRTEDTGHADSHFNWLICGGSGYSLRRQRSQGEELTEPIKGKSEESRLVARSHLFVGRSGHGSTKRRPYSCLRIEVKSGSPPKFFVQPLIVEKFQKDWHNYQMESFTI